MMQPRGRLDAKERPLDLIVAEDNSDLRALWELHVERWEFPVRLTLVEEGFGAILAMAESAPDLVITDLSMPGAGVNGRALIEIMARCPPYDRIPIIVVSSSPSLDDMLKYPSVIACFRKPIFFCELKHFIKERFFSGVATAEGLGKASSQEDGDGNQVLGGLPSVFAETGQNESSLRQDRRDSQSGVTTRKIRRLPPFLKRRQGRARLRPSHPRR